MGISPVIIVKDAERTIAKTLDSLKEFDEVIVLDTGSLDNTLEIVNNYENVKLSHARFEGFSKSKNRAAKLAKNDWILSIDADEVLSPGLMDSIRELKPEQGYTYRFKRNNYYRNKIIKHSGWGREYVVRIYNRTTNCFNKKLVHEHINCPPNKIVTIKGDLRHYSYHSISNFVTKRDVYSELFAIEYKKKRRSSPFLALIRGAFDFMNTYIIKLGVLDGYRGILISVSNANVTFYKYLKLYEANNCNTKKISLIVRCEDEVDKLEPLIKSISAQTIPPDEIIFSLGENSDNYINELKILSRRTFIPINYVYSNDSELPFEKAITTAKYDFLVVIDANTILAKTFISRHVEKAKAGVFAINKCEIVTKEKYKKLIKSVIKGNQVRAKASYLRIFKASQLPRPQCNSFSFFMEDYIGHKITEKEHSSFEDDLLSFGLRRKELKHTSLQFVQEPVEKKKVLVCLDRLKLINCGLGQVALNFGRELVKLKPEGVELVFLLPSKGFKEFEKNVSFIKLNTFRSIFSGYMNKFDLCHITHQLPSYSFGESKKNILTIHDLNFLFTKSKLKSNRYLKRLQKNVDKSDTVVFISDFTKQITYEYLQIPESKEVKVIHNGVRIPEESLERPAWLPNKKFFFSIGQFLEKKNFHVLLPFIKLFPEDFVLIVAGENKTNYGQRMRQTVAELGLEKQVIFPGGITEKEKGFLYNNCEAFLFPSIAEGFGLPVIEAMLCSKPVFCSDRTSLREIGKDFAFFWTDFVPENMFEIYKKGMVTFGNTGYMEKQKEYANIYTYKRNVAEYFDIYNKQLMSS